MWHGRVLTQHGGGLAKQECWHANALACFQLYSKLAVFYQLGFLLELICMAQGKNTKQKKEAVVGVGMEGRKSVENHSL